MTALARRPTTRINRCRAPVVATWTCVAVAITCLVGARVVPEMDDLDRTAPLVVFGLLWGLAAFLLRYRSRGGPARLLAIFSVAAMVVSAVAASVWVSGSGGGTLRLTPAGAVQLIVPFVGAIIVLVALRPAQRPAWTPRHAGGPTPAAR